MAISEKIHIATCCYKKAVYNTAAVIANTIHII